MKSPPLTPVAGSNGAVGQSFGKQPHLSSQQHPQGSSAKVSSSHGGAGEHGRTGSQAGGGGARASHMPPHGSAQATDNPLLDLLRRYPVMWQGHLSLKNDAAAVQLHFLSGNAGLAKQSLPAPVDQRTPVLRIDKRMRLEPTQLEGVERRMQVSRQGGREGGRRGWFSRSTQSTALSSCSLFAASLYVHPSILPSSPTLNSPGYI